MFLDLFNDLVNVLHHNAYLNVTVDERLQKSNYDDHEKRLYTKIIYGVVEKKLYIDYELSTYTSGKRVKPLFKNALRCGIYSIIFLNLKDYYIVNEIVKIIKDIDFNASKFVNWVLRSFIRDGIKEVKGNNIDKLSINLSIPLDIVNLLYEQYNNKIIDFYTIDEVYNSYRICHIDKNKEVVLLFLKDNNINYELDNNILYTKESLINTTIFQEGLIISQDKSSTIPSIMIDPKEDELILDACSAPGGKSLYMAELSNDKSYIYACDIYEEKLNKIKFNKDKLGFKSINTFIADAATYNYNMLFDKILLDVPCSGLGTINHKPDLKYNISINDINDIIILQRKILINTSKYLKKGGVLVYSTCTINKYENEYQIDSFLKENNNFTKVCEQIIYPSNKSDGFYICKLIKE